MDLFRAERIVQDPLIFLIDCNPVWYGDTLNNGFTVAPAPLDDDSILFASYRAR